MKLRSFYLVTLLSSVLVTVGIFGGKSFLPVTQVWFGQSDLPVAYSMSTLKSWTTKVSEWDWVKSYRAKWIYPGQLILDIQPKVPVAIRDNGEFVDAEGAVFHLSTYKDPLPKIAVPDHNIPQALQLLSVLHSSAAVQGIKFHPSGSVWSEFASGEQLIFSSFEHDPNWINALSNAKQHFKTPNVICDYRQKKYVACYTAA